MTKKIDNYALHYTNKRSRHGQTVWGAAETGISYDYSDRLWQWDYDKAESASSRATKDAEPQTAKWVELFLSNYFCRPVEIRHIMAGWDWDNGYPYQVFGYRFKDVKP